MRELLDYDESTGVFRWAVSRGAVKQGETTGYQRKDGYMSIRIFGRNYPAHRLAWLHVTGQWPTGQIDHINRVRSDNRWDNLRDCTASQNRQNMTVPSHNKSGYRGVSWDAQSRKWRAGIKYQGKSRNLGGYDTPEEAARAYAAAAAAFHTHNALAKPDARLVQLITSRHGQFRKKSTRLAPSDVLEIRASTSKTAELSQRFCVSKNTIRQVKRGLLWKTL